MTKRTPTQRVVTAGILVAAGLILPYATSHMFAIQGTLLLPMHIPVLLCGLLCGAKYGALCGLLIPALSSVLTGMPPAFPMLPIMATQLTVLGLLSGLLYDRFNLNLLLSTAVSMAAGWAAYGAVFGILVVTTGGALRALSVGAALVTGIPGIAIQLIICPLLVKAINRSSAVSEIKEQEDDTMIPKACKLISGGDVSCVVIQNDTIVHSADGRGVSPLRNVYENEPQLLKNSVVVDKIIGKAAAVILVLGGVQHAHGVIMSHAARDYLEQYGITASFDRCIDVISARSGSGICPIEKSVIDIADPHEAYASMVERIEELSKAG